MGVLCCLYNVATNDTNTSSLKILWSDHVDELVEEYWVGGQARVSKASDGVLPRHFEAEVHVVPDECRPR